MIELLNMDCMDYLRECPDNAFDAVITDPPYFRVKGEPWDRQWDKPDKFLLWIGELCRQFRRVVKPNGSLYLFASPQMAGRVECVIREHFNVLNHITWRKGRSGFRVQGWSQKTAKENLRCFIPETEKVIFAEHYGADNISKGEAGYQAKCDELRGFLFEPLREYLAGERDKAGFTTRKVAEEYQKKTGSRTVTGMAGHWFDRVQWELPTRENYEWLRWLFGDGFLRREYEELRREYEELRRPFRLTAKDQWGDVWEFDPVQNYPSKHPCEKPQTILRHILKASVKPGGCVLDPFMGSGSMGIASYLHGCDFVGVELDKDYFEAAKARIENETKQVDMFGGAA